MPESARGRERKRGTQEGGEGEDGLGGGLSLGLGPCAPRGPSHTPWSCVAARSHLTVSFQDPCFSLPLGPSPRSPPHEVVVLAGTGCQGLGPSHPSKASLL